MIAISLSSALIYKLFQENMKSQIIIITDESQVDVTDIYFPAITFCPSLILNTIKDKTIDYNRITEALKNHVIKIESLSLDEYVKYI